MAKSVCPLLIQVNHVYVTIFNVANMSLNAFGENKILAKISKFTVVGQLMRFWYLSHMRIVTLLNIHMGESFQD